MFKKLLATAPPVSPEVATKIVNFFCFSKAKIESKEDKYLAP